MKLLLIVLAIALGIWLAFNYPDVAQTILDYVMMGVDYLWKLIQGALQ